jgi:hypothetical protein
MKRTTEPRRLNITNLDTKEINDLLNSIEKNKVDFKDGENVYCYYCNDDKKNDEWFYFGYKPLEEKPNRKLVLEKPYSDFLKEFGNEELKNNINIEKNREKLIEKILESTKYIF